MYSLTRIDRTNGTLVRDIEEGTPQWTDAIRWLAFTLSTTMVEVCRRLGHTIDGPALATPGYLYRLEKIHDLPSTD